MSSNPDDARSPLLKIEACARQLREDIERGKLWPGEYAKAVAESAETVRALPEGNRR